MVTHSEKSIFGMKMLRMLRMQWCAYSEIFGRVWRNDNFMGRFVDAFAFLRIGGLRWRWFGRGVVGAFVFAVFLHVIQHLLGTALLN